MKNRWMLIAALTLCACERQAPPAPSAEQSARLDEAEAMLNALANEEGAASEDTAPPSNQG